MQLSTTYSFNRIQKDWTRIYNAMANPSPFLHPSAFRIAHRYFYPYYLAKRCLPQFAVITEAGEVAAIVPLLKYRNSLHQLFGFPNGFNWGGC